jgi:type II secretion system protein I
VSGQRGFTLMEVLIATSVAAIAVVAALELFSGSTRLAGAATDQTKALVIARSVMDQALWRVDLEVGTERGKVDQFQWYREVVKWTPRLAWVEGGGDLGEQEKESDDFELRGVLVVVSWTNPGGIDKEVSLSSARIMEKF